MKTTKTTVAPLRDYTALFTFLAHAPIIEQVKQSQLLQLRHGNQSMSVTNVELSLLATKGLVTRKGNTILLTDAGLQFVQLGQRNQNIQVTIREDGPVLINCDESPLSSLANRKQADGRPFLQTSEYEAGERVRLDFTRALLMPRTTANWQPSVLQSRRTGASNSVEDITHSAMAARNRLDTALQCLGHDLAGVVTDICCFLKGFEQVELERRWPKRSAKFMLKAALATLALHYNPPTKSTRTSHKWGASDYRPKLS